MASSHQPQTLTSDSESDSDFEFAFAASPSASPTIYPVFNRDFDLDFDFQSLSLHEPPQNPDDPSSYCVWTPPDAAALDPKKKCKSTGTSSTPRWRFRDFVVGRSRSDGKEKFVFLPPSPPEEGKGEKGEGKKIKTRRVREMDMVTAHKLYYGKPGAGDRRQSYLPYKRGLVGFFAGVNGTGSQPF